MKVFICIVLLSVVMGLSSCRSVRYVPVETVRTQTEYRDRVRRDSIHVRDSVLVFQKGDTVFRDRWHTEYKDRKHVDTLFIERSDTIRVPYPVEKELSRWQSLKLELGGWAFGVIIGAVVTAFSFNLSVKCIAPLPISIGDG